MRFGPLVEASVHTDSSASRAEPPPERRMSRVLGVAVVIVILVGFVWKGLSQRPSTVPLGIVGLGFGMSPERAREAFGALDEIAPDVPAGVDPGTQLPRLRGRATVFDEPATCSLWFAVEHTLSKIECALDPAPDEESHARVSKRILVLLQKLYGPEQNAGTDGGYHSWQNQRAKLTLLLPTKPGTIVIANVSARHDAAVVELLAAAKGAEQRQRIQGERDALEKRLEELKRLERERLEQADAAP